MNAELEPLEADVLSLLRAEKPIADLAPAAKAAILASVEARIGLPPAPGCGDGGGAGGAGGNGGSGVPGAAGAGLTGARAIAAIAVTFAIGVATGVVVAPSVSPPANGVKAAPVAIVRAESPPGASTSLPVELPAVSVGSLPAASATGAPRVVKVESPEAPAPSARGLGAERSLLDVARAALARGEASEALAAVDRHAREYPEGALVEEREALAIKALVALGRRDEARTRAQRFEQRYPNGLLLRAVKGAVGAP